MLESSLEKRFVREVRKTGSTVWKFTSPGTPGVPDRIVLIPGGMLLFVELKRPGGKLRPLQEKRKRDLENLGFIVEVIDSIERIEEVCRAIQTTQLSGIRD